DIHQQDKDRQEDDGNRDGDDLAGDVPWQPFEFEKDQPCDERIDAEKDNFHQMFPLWMLSFSSSSATRARKVSSSDFPSFPVSGWPLDSSASVPYAILCKTGF